MLSILEMKILRSLSERPGRIVAVSGVVPDSGYLAGGRGDPLTHTASFYRGGYAYELFDSFDSARIVAVATGAGHVFDLSEEVEITIQ